MNSRSKTSRRGFLGLAGAVLAVVPRGSRAALRPATPDGKSRVVISRDPQLRKPGAGMDPDRLLKLLDHAVQAFYDRDNASEAWRLVARPGEVVGLKVNCLAGRGISTNVPLVEAIAERLQQAGIRDIVIWDRLNSDLESARFRIKEKDSGISCFGNHNQQRSVGVIAPLQRIHAATGVLRNRRPKPRYWSGLADSRRVIAHRDQDGHTTVRPSLNAHPVRDDVTASPQIAKRAVGVERTDGLFTHLGGPVLITALRKTSGITARTKTIHQQG